VNKTGRGGSREGIGACLDDENKKEGAFMAQHFVALRDGRKLFGYVRRIVAD